MREALLLCGLLATAAAGLRCAARGAAGLGVAGALLSLLAVAFAAFAPIPTWLAALSLVHAVATLGKLLALGRFAVRPSPVRGLAYLALYPGLDPTRAFLPDPEARRAAGARAAMLGLLEGLAAFVVARLAERLGLLDAGAYPAAGARSASFVLLLDGGFRLAAGAQRALGLHAEDLFREPWLLTDLADFWSRRWNLFVSRTLVAEVYAPIKRRAGRLAAVGATFLASGVFHEALFGLSARGPVPEGRYTAFFLAQAVGILGLAWLLPPRSGRTGLRRAAAWAVLLATAPLFFGGAFPAAVPLETLLRGLF